MLECEPPSRPVRLPHPRALSADERALLDWFVDVRAKTSRIRAQADVALVVATCSCGCPSVHLGVASGAPVAALDGRDPDVRNGGDASFIAEARSPDGRRLDVTLHVVAGRLTELEIWAATFGGDVRTGLPRVETLGMRLASEAPMHE